MRNRRLDLCLKVRSQPQLWTAWRRVYRNGITSKSRETRAEVKAFLITTQAKRNLSSRSGIGGVLSAT